MSKTGEHLLVDIGNTRVKAAHFTGDTAQTVFLADSSNSEELISLLQKYAENYERIFVCSVVNEVACVLKDGIQNLHIFSYTDIPEDHLGYKTSESLGLDRFFSAFGAWSLHKKACIVVDSGTACTVDLISAEGKYMGGVIMPGLKTMHDALISKTSMLPETKFRIPENWPPQTTESALEWGITGSFIDALKAHIIRHRKSVPQAEIIVTGGDAPFVCKNIAESALHDDIIFKGMRALSALL